MKTQTQDPLRPQPAATLAAAFEETRARTLLLVQGLDATRAGVAAAPYLSPPVWDLGHIANFQDLWLLQHLDGRPERRPGKNDTYDAFAHTRPERPRLRLLDLPGALAYLADVQDAVLARLPHTDLGPQAKPTAQGGFLHWMLVLHEHQHQETLIQSFAMHGDGYRPARIEPPPAPEHGRIAPEWCTVPGGTSEIGRAQGARVYDNEAPPHRVKVPTFEIARYPVTNGAFLDFVEAGGYREPRWWSARGQAWLKETGAEAPLYWERDPSGAWHRRVPRDGLRAVHDVADEILCHVSYFEAEAYAAYRGARLPTEHEWERACRSGLHPWGDAPADTGRANIDQLSWGPSRVGAFPAGRAPCGTEHMIGDVWEWCASGFEAYPGFEAFPYREYSEVFFGGDYKVLRGGSWATRAPCATGTFRNWDHPYRRQIFAGMRLARDPGDGPRSASAAARTRAVHL